MVLTAAIHHGTCPSICTVSYAGVENVRLPRIIVLLHLGNSKLKQTVIAGVIQKHIMANIQYKANN